MFSSIDLLLSVTFLVACGCAGQQKVFIFWVMVMYTDIKHSEVHIVLSMLFSMDNEHLILAIGGDTILLNEIIEGDEVGDRFLVELCMLM